VEYKTSGIEIEMRILGGAFVSSDWANDLVSSIGPQYFLNKENREVYTAISYLIESDQTTTLSKVINLAQSKGVSADHCMTIREVGASRSISFSDLLDHIKSTFFKSRMAEIGAKLAASSLSSKKSESDLLNEVEEDIYSIHGSLARKKSAQLIFDILNKPEKFSAKTQILRDRFKSGEEVFDGIPTGFVGLDKLINSLKPGHLTLVGARPSVGKTTFATNLVEHLCVKLKLPGLFFSLEMPSYELSKKILLQLAEVETGRYDKGDLSDEENSQINAANKALEKISLIIEDQPSLSIDQIKSRAYRTAKTTKIKFIIIDYVQLITCKTNSENRTTEVGQISRTLKEIAKTLEIPIIGLAQLNRQSDKRESKVPMMSDLRESGSLEADADEILLLHRPDQYDELNKKGIMQIIVAKNRFGATGLVELNFKKEIGKLKSIAPYEKEF